MDINTVSPTTSSPGFAPQTETSEAVISSDFETFLRMLTVQMENQDPLDPTDSAEFAMQLATFSGVEQQVLTNDLLNALMMQMNTSGMAQMADWVGKEARAAMPVNYVGDPVTIAPNPAAVADKVELVVYDSDGQEVARNDIPKSTDPIEWTGVDANGATLPHGVYSFRVISSANGEVILQEAADVYSTVQEVQSENGQAVLVMDGGISINASDANALRTG